MSTIDPRKNYEETRKEIGYVTREEATLNDYKRIGFKSGLEVHQQLKTKSKLFCRCPAGIFHDDNDYDAEVIRHMRPTLSEMGVYDGTALMEFRTRKEITYRINNETACTYEVDDTPPFPIDREALEIAISIALTARMNIVGEVHITRKQYLDGSIPTGFQRSAIISVEGELQLKNKKVRLIQLSLEEDSCREVSDIGHKRIYKTDRLGMPLIETVTYPDCLTPDELAEAAEYIRFLNRSTGKVRTGMGAAREDVNVSCEGGSRAEIKGVAHIKWIPELSHNEAFRQYALLNIRSKLQKLIPDQAVWAIKTREITEIEQMFHFAPVRAALDRGEKVMALNLPGCRGILSHFTQPGLIFADEISDRLKVIACIEKPNMTHSEEISEGNFNNLFPELAIWLSAGPDDAQIILWGPADDIRTALETVEERIRLALEGVPNETRKAFEDGTTMFERVLPGRDRMYPDTDSQPIPVTTEMLDRLGQNHPVDVAERFRQMKEWGLPEDTWHYLLSKNLVVLIERIGNDLGFNHREIGILLGHRFRSLDGRGRVAKGFSREKLYDLFAFIRQEKLLPPVARIMLPAVVAVPSPDFGSILAATGLRRASMDEITRETRVLVTRFPEVCQNGNMAGIENWVMGQLHMKALGTVRLSDVRKAVSEILEVRD
ncbi:Glu-tRNA(Gln) amidotransferase subunit GatE [bacterium]|nr:Glu-tRNA(Gln) amidotransferase subunit GatE [bacterium]